MNPGEITQAIEDFLDRHPTAAGDIVDIGGNLRIDQGQVGTDHVIDVEEIAHREKIADPHDRLLASELDACQLTREIRDHEEIGLTGARMIEGAHSDDIQATRGRLLAE